MTVPVPQGAVRFESGTNSQLVLDVDAAGGIIQQVRSESSQTQVWQLLAVSGAEGLYHIVRFGNTAQALVATGDLTLGVQPLVPTVAAHRWALRQVSGDVYAIENQQGPRVLSVLEASSQPGASIILWNNLNAQNQRWRLISSEQPASMPNYMQANRPPDFTYVRWGVDRWSSDSATWVDLPGATVPLQVGSGSPSNGAYFIATFSAEAICESPVNNGVTCATVFFGNAQADPVSDNHRYVTARGNPEWSSRAFMRTAKFDPSTPLRDVTAKVRVQVVGGTMAFQNWLLKIERYNL